MHGDKSTVYRFHNVQLFRKRRETKAETTITRTLLHRMVRFRAGEDGR